MFLDPLFRSFSFEMTVSIASSSGVCCSSAIPSIEPSSIKEEMVLIEGVVVLAFTVDIALIK